jgi:hypothetical protein
VTTERELDALTDSGLFEKLSVAVLRAANPDYRRLIHVGMNADGRTIPSSVDALVPPAGGTKMVVTACTTTARNRLRDKWLRPETGDVPNAIVSAQEFRRANPFRQQFSSCVPTELPLSVCCTTSARSALRPE